MYGSRCWKGYSFLKLALHLRLGCVEFWGYGLFLRKNNSVEFEGYVGNFEASPCS